ncbi:MAG TPA: DUF6483 family protein [Rhodothermales bacterium]
MITRDFILRQIHQMVQALAQVLIHRQAGQLEEAKEALERSLQDVTGLEMQRLRRLSREELLALCGAGKEFSPDKAAALADLFYEDSDPDGRRRALWLYEAALESNATLPMDMQQRVALLRAESPQ